jgi:hypothetical protein
MRRGIRKASRSCWVRSGIDGLGVPRGRTIRKVCRARRHDAQFRPCKSVMSGISGDPYA